MNSLMSINGALFLAPIAGLLVASAAAAESATGWRPDLDWGSLEAQLSSTATLIDTSFADFQRECVPEFADKPWPERTNHALIDQPSGMCVDQLFCAYERCYHRPDADGHANTTLSQRLSDTADTFSASWDALSPESQGWLEDPANPALNLPSKVLFPVVASDVVAAVNFARENGLEISVKNSGHSFMGASTKRDTLHINMNRFTQYAPTSVVDCAASAPGFPTEEDLRDQPCTLAVARAKPGYIRVGGGENWDKTYRAVKDANEAQGNRFHVIGGAAGTVSPMGWTFHGGLAGTVGGPMYGFGVDQILMVEMVLPSGQHVKFGPAEWEDSSADGFIVPKTTSVRGVCRSNPQEQDEDKWEWASCPESANINFDDLWFAVCGGGGGTWGVVTSIYLQLHEYIPPFMYGYFPGFCDELAAGFVYIFESFRASYFLAPSVLNVTQADSDACGSPDGAGMLCCFGEGPYQAMLNAWKSYLTTNQHQLPNGVTVDDVLACGQTADIPYVETVAFDDGPYAGRVQDSPQPTIQAGANEAELNVLLPKEYLEDNIDEFVEQLVYQRAPGHPYYAFGYGTAGASDQANSLSAGHRGAGVKVYLEPEIFYSQLFGRLYDLSDKTNFPGFLGSNHAGNNMMGPLKDDWTKACPQEWTQQERDEKCISIQEAIYGTKTLSRLEAIKEALDPNYVLDCVGCIGNNRAKKNSNVATSPGENSEVATSNGENSEVVTSAGFLPPAKLGLFYLSITLAFGVI